MSPYVGIRKLAMDHAEPLEMSERCAPASTSNAKATSSSQGHLQLEAERLIAKMKANEVFTAGISRDMTGLPRFCNITAYGVLEDSQLDLFAMEIRRLVELTGSDKPLQLGGEEEWFGDADADGYTRLDKLARQIRLATEICEYDLCLQTQKHCSEISVDGPLRDSKTHLLGIFGPRALEDPATAWEKMKLDRNNDQALRAVVDYLTGCILRVLLQVMSGRFWSDNCVIFMAQCAAKLKVVAGDLAVCAAASVESHTPATKITNLEFRYFDVHHMLGGNILGLVRVALTSMASSRDAGLPPNDFESSVILYDTGFDDYGALFCQERNGGIGLSSARQDVVCASIASEICRKIFEGLKRRKDHVGTKADFAAAMHPTCSRQATEIHWNVTEVSTTKPLEAHHVSTISTISTPQSGRLVLSSMSAVITALVPFFLLCGPFLANLSHLMRGAISYSDPGNSVHANSAKRILASYMVRSTGPGLPREAEDIERGGLAGVTKLSSHPIAEDRSLATGPMSTMTRTLEFSRRRLLARNAEIKNALATVDEWDIGPASITIQSRLYCWGTLALAAILVMGGLSIGLTVNDRIPGVDPSNLSVFCWGVAGFFVLMMKGWRVDNWPWRDFLRGRVVCRSVSEVAAVTNMDTQLFMTILLRLERTIILNKSGPFCGVFNRDPKLPGFCIDIPMSNRALAEAGCFFVVVLNVRGPALVAIRAVADTFYESLGPWLKLDGTSVIWVDLSSTGAVRCGKNGKRTYRVSHNGELDWSRIMGIYNEDNVYFG